MLLFSFFYLDPSRGCSPLTFRPRSPGKFEIWFNLDLKSHFRNTKYSNVLIANTVGRITYIVLAQTLNHAQPTL